MRFIFHFYFPSLLLSLWYQERLGGGASFLTFKKSLSRFETEASLKAWENLLVKLMKMGVLFVGRSENIRSIWFMLVRLFRFSHSNTDHLQFLKADRGRFLGTCPFCLRFKSILSRPCGALCSPVPECPWPPPHLLCTSVTSLLLLSLLRTGW